MTKDIFIDGEEEYVTVIREPDIHVVACNLTEATSTASTGTLAYVIEPNPGNGYDRLQLLIRSRSGRLINKWESSKRLDNFRLKTIPSEHPLYERLCIEGWTPNETMLAELRAISAT